MDLEMNMDKVKKLEHELSELTTAEKDDKEVQLSASGASWLFSLLPFMNITSANSENNKYC